MWEEIVVSVLRTFSKAILLISVLFVLSSSVCVRAQNATRPFPDDFPIGLVLEYDLKDVYWGGGGLADYSSVTYQFISWINVQSVVQINQTGGRGISGAKCVQIPSWNILYWNGTPTGEYMYPLWVNVTGWQAGQTYIPEGSAYSRSYDLAYEVRSVPAGDFVCWRCGAQWNESGMECSTYLFYDTALGVLVEVSASFRGPSDSYGFPNVDQHEQTLTDSNIALFVTTGPLFSGLTLVVLWGLWSLAILAIPVILTIRRKGQESTNAMAHGGEVS